jgi:hypothetical protein
MFDLRPLPGSAPRIQAKTEPVNVTVPAVTPSAATAPASGGWSHDALARFKTLPGVSKYKT